MPTCFMDKVLILLHSRVVSENSHLNQDEESLGNEEAMNRRMLDIKQDDHRKREH